VISQGDAILKALAKPLHHTKGGGTRSALTFPFVIWKRKSHYLDDETVPTVYMVAPGADSGLEFLAGACSPTPIWLSRRIAEPVKLG
jgi:hypothetical protein